MLNKESRKYFNRAFASSGSAFSFYALSKDDHLKRMQEFSKINDKDKLIEFLKTANSKELSESQPFSFGKILYAPWVPTIESSTTKGAFISTKPDEIYNSNEAPVLDSLFSVTSVVFNLIALFIQGMFYNLFEYCSGISSISNGLTQKRRTTDQERL